MGRTAGTEQFAALLRMLKERSGVSFEALARRTGISRSSLHRYCSGAKLPTNDNVVRTFAKACGATDEELRELHRLWTLAVAERAPSASAKSGLPERQETLHEASDSQTPQQATPGSRFTVHRLLAAFASISVIIAGLTLWRILDEPESSTAAKIQGNITIPAIIKVFNVETGCQNRVDRFHACSLGLSRDPYKKYEASNVVSHRVWHGDILYADCVVHDGDRVEDERGVSSTRWFRVRLNNVEGGFAWLPAVRSANGPPLPSCN